MRFLHGKEENITLVNIHLFSPVKVKVAKNILKTRIIRRLAAVMVFKLLWRTTLKNRVFQVSQTTAQSSKDGVQAQYRERSRVTVFYVKTGD